EGFVDHTCAFLGLTVPAPAIGPSHPGTPVVRPPRVPHPGTADASGSPPFAGRQPVQLDRAGGGVKVSTRGDYASRALLSLALHADESGPTSVRDIAERTGLPQ